MKKNIYIMYVYNVYICSFIFFCYDLLQDVEFGSLCYTIRPCCLSILYNSSHLLVPNSQSNAPLPLLFLGNQKSVLYV